MPLRIVSFPGRVNRESTNGTGNNRPDGSEVVQAYPIRPRDIVRSCELTLTIEGETWKGTPKEGSYCEKTFDDMKQLLPSTRRYLIPHIETEDERLKTLLREARESRSLR